MISQIQEMEEIIPIYGDYLKGMSQYYNISNCDAWRASALKNLKKHEASENQPVFSMEKSNAIIGFVIVNTHLRFNKKGRAIAEFHILKKHSRKGYGRILAEYVFDKFPGQWEVVVSDRNKEGIGFWKQVVSSYTPGNFTQRAIPAAGHCGFLFNTNPLTDQG